MIQSERSQKPATLVVDAGNFAPLMGVGCWEKGSFVWDLMARVGYDAATPGDHDLLQGLDSLRAMAARHPEIRMVSANLLDPWGKRVFPESAVITKGNVRFGVTGITDSLYHRANVRQGRAARDEFDFESAETALRRVVPKLRVESDVVVVLLHTRYEEALRLAGLVPGVDVAVAGHDPGFVREPERTVDGYLLRPGNRGQSASVVMLGLDPESRKVTHALGAGKLLDESVPMDTGFVSFIEGWEKDFRARHGLAPAAAETKSH